jgi:4'-phosphopantetheinyl transferase
MPLEDLHITDDCSWALWKITENETVLAPRVTEYESLPETITNPYKRLEFLAGRVLIAALLETWKMEFTGLVKDESGKPFFKDLDAHLSLSHSYPYVAAIIHRNKAVGIDLEQPKEKLLRIAHRVLNQAELEDASHDLTKHCIYWCAKETLIKIYGKKHLTLAKNLAVEPFVLQKQGFVNGRIIADDMDEKYRLHYTVYDNFVVVLNT